MKEKIIVSSLRPLETINVVMDRSFLNNLEVSPMSDIATNESMQY